MQIEISSLNKNCNRCNAKANYCIRQSDVKIKSITHHHTIEKCFPHHHSLVFLITLSLVSVIKVLNSRIYCLKIENLFAHQLPWMVNPLIFVLAYCPRIRHCNLRGKLILPCLPTDLWNSSFDLISMLLTTNLKLKWNDNKFCFKLRSLLWNAWVETVTLVRAHIIIGRMYSHLTWYAGFYIGWQ